MTWEDIIKLDYVRDVIDFGQFEDEISALLEHGIVSDRVVGGLPAPQFAAGGMVTR